MHNLFNKYINSFALFLCIIVQAALFASCTGEEEMENKHAIRFQIPENMLRASETDEINIADFRVWSVWTNNSESVLFMNNVKVERVNESWIYSPVHYRPTEGTLDFFAYSPASSSGVLDFDSENIKIRYDVTTDHRRQEDFLVAGALKPTTTTPVVLDFKHVLSQIEFRVKSGIPGIIFQIKKIELKNLLRKGTLTGIESVGEVDWQWTDFDYTTRETYSVYMPQAVSAGASYISLTDSEVGNLMILPQTVSITDNNDDFRFVVTYDVYDNTNTLIESNIAISLAPSSNTSSPTEFEFEPGKKYTFNLDLTQITP